MQHLFGDGEAILQQDNATFHVANSVKSWAAEQNLQILPWPGNSPAINPIEDVWDYIERKIRDTYFKNADELQERIQAEWNAQPLDYLSDLIDSMPRRINAVIKAKVIKSRY